VSKFEEQSHYVIGNNSDAKKQTQNKANFLRRKYVDAGRATAVRQAGLALDCRLLI
jgi:hypothetical protein